MESNHGKDLTTIQKQLGRAPRVFRKVVTRCPHGFPLTIECEPELNGAPFPTLYWLTCPFLRKKISQLEAEGKIRDIENLLETDQEFKKKYFMAHDKIIELRDKLVRNQDVRIKLRKMGTGGIRNFSTVKCLHLHVADYLSGVKNPIGEIVLLKIDKLYCSPDSVLCK